ncbi:MAG: low specificity L-threonine aldolase, partial [Ignavibacteriae bacterium]|nr:low specificity L-threonine aldolase [Ignavibacteriota bacterium]
DSVSVCLSKGLGAPVGSVIAGPKGFVEEARRYRKIFGGGMRQAGILAAAGIYALEHNVDRLKEDHVKARYLAGELAEIKSLTIDMETVQTNIVIIGVQGTEKTPPEVISLLHARNLLLTLGNYDSVRAVAHMDVSMDDVKCAATIMKEVLARP